MVNIELVNNTAEVTVYPVNITNYLPHFMSPSKGTSLLNELTPQCPNMTITENGTGKLYYLL